MKVDLAQLKKRMQPRSILAVTLESGRVVVNHLRLEKGEVLVVKTFSFPLGTEAVASDPEKAAVSFSAQLEAASIRERRCVVCIPPGWAMTTATDVPGVSSDDLAAYLELRAEREFPVPPADLRLSHCAYTLSDGRQRATLAAVPMKRLEAVERMLAAAGCRAVSISFGLDGCVPRGDQPPGLHFRANGNHVDVIVAAGGGIAALRSLPGPTGPDATGFDAPSFSREIRITLGGLPEDVRQQIRQARFTGMPASAETLCLEIRQPLHRMGIESRLERLPADEFGELEGAAISAATLYLRQQPAAFEFVPPQVHRWQVLARRFDSSRRRTIIVGAVALLALLILAFFIHARIESNLAAEWKGMSANVSDLEQLQQRIREFRPWFNAAPENLQILESLASAFPEQGDVWAKSIQVGEGAKVTCTGFARNQAALMGFFDRLRNRPDTGNLQVQQVRGENPVQFSIVYKWELRDAK